MFKCFFKGWRETRFFDMVVSELKFNLQIITMLSWKNDAGGLGSELRVTLRVRAGVECLPLA